MAAIGIDLGTTTTLIAEAYAGATADEVEIDLLRTKQRENTGGEVRDIEVDHLPSFAYFPPNSEQLVGKEAKDVGPGKNELDHCVRAVKRLMGRDLVLPDPINKTPAQVSALYLQYVLRHVRQTNKFTDRDHLTVTVPASFTSNQRRDTLRALDLALASLNIVLPQSKLARVLISEPVAALLSYLVQDLRNAEALRRLNFNREPRILVYDMGGGTLDLTLVRLGWRDPSLSKTLGNVRFDVEEMNRYNQFAGEDFDMHVARVLLNMLVEAHPQLGNLDLADKEAQTLRFFLVEDAERLKIELNNEIAWSGDDAEIPFTFSKVLGGREYSVSKQVTSLEYQQWVAPFLQYREDQKNALYPIESLLSRSGLRLDDIDYFLLVGGMGRFLPLQTALKAYWGRSDSFLVHPTPDHAVAEGAAVYSYLKATREDFAIQEPPADAYYVRRSKGFGLLLGRGNQAQGEMREYELQGEGDRLKLQIFAGEPVPASGDIEHIYPSLVYQGTALVPLRKTYPKGTKVWVKMSYHEDDNSKVPYLNVWVGNETNQVASVSYSELQESGAV